MDYTSKLKELQTQSNPTYPRNDIGIARLFYDLHKDTIRYVVEARNWYIFKTRLWVKDEGGFYVMERCKEFAQSLLAYAEAQNDGSEEGIAFIKYAGGLTSRKRREGIIADARSIQPMSLSQFDRDKMLFNCQNGTISLSQMALLPHNPDDYITKIAKVNYVEGAVCERWEQFINEIMCDDAETAKFLQKALGYCLSGETSLECFFILYGNTTRNGKSTLTETVANILGDYARTIQPQTLSRRPNDGASPTPDIARLKGARLVNMPEPEKGLGLNTALIKQLTGGDTYTGRFLHENPIEYRPEFKIFINTNHLPQTTDDTVFSSGRVKLIPFNRHFSPAEQDNSLKKLFREGESKSGILNWLIAGNRILQAEGLAVPEIVNLAIEEYRQDGDDIGVFLSETLVTAEGNRLKTSGLFKLYISWTKANGFRPMSNQDFVGELRKRYEIKRDSTKGNVVVGFSIRK